MALRLLALRPDNQEVHDDEDQDERHELDDQIRRAAGGSRGLGKGLRHKHLFLPDSGLFTSSSEAARTIARRAIIANDIGTDLPSRTLGAALRRVLTLAALRFLAEMERFRCP